MLTNILRQAGYPEETLTLDFESYFDSEYSFKTLSTIEYITDKRFAFTGLGLKFSSEPPIFIPGTQALYAAIGRLRNRFNNLTVIIQNAKFDATVLSEKFDIYLPYVIDILDLARYYDSRMKHDLGSMAKLFKIRAKGDTKQFMGQHWEDMDHKAMKEYCLGDVEIEYDLCEKLLPMIDNPEIELPLMQHTLDLYLKPPFRLDTKLAQEIADGMLVELDKDIEKVSLLVMKYATKKKVTPIGIIRAKSIFPKILADALPEGEKVPMKQGKKGMIPALAQEDVAFQLLLAHSDERVRNLCKAKAACTSWPLHQAKVEGLIKQAACAGGDLHAPLKYYGAHCMPGSAEVLTRLGWKRLDQWGGGLIAQWSPDFTIRFLVATPNAIDIDETCVQIDAPYLQAFYTKGHNIPRYGSGNKNFMPCKAGHLFRRAISYIPIAGVLKHNGSLTPDKMRILVAIQADGSWCTNTRWGRGLTFNLTKPRKQERLRRLLEKVNIPFGEHKYPSHPREICFKIKWADIPKWLKPSYKVFGSWLLDSTDAARKAFVEELVYWDGHNGVMPEYYSSLLVNHEWVTTICHLVGFGANTVKNDIVTTIRKTRSPGFTCVHDTHCSEKDFYGTVYCPTTQTGYWLVRYAGKIHVTGNTGRWSGMEGINLLNMGGKGRGKPIHPLIAKVRNTILPSENHKFIIVDSAQIEARELAWISGQNDLVEDFRTGGDPYSRLATKVFGEKVWKPTAEEKKMPEGQTADVRRGFGKDTILGAGFGLGSNTFFDRCRQNETLRPMFDSGEYTWDFIDKLIKTYRSDYPRIPAFWRSMEKCFRWVTKYPNEVMTYFIPDDKICLHEGMDRAKPIIRNAILTFWKEGSTTIIQLPSGRRLFYRYAAANPQDKSLKYIWGPLWGGTLTENVIQAICRDLLAGWLLECERQGIHIVLHSYDELVGCVPDDRAEWALVEMKKIMTTGPDWAAGLPLGVEGEIAECYKK